MEHDAWFFVGVFVFIFLIWIATGGPTHPIAFSGPTLHAPQELGGGTYLSFPRSTFGFGGTNISLPGSSDDSSTGNTKGSLPTLPIGSTFGEISPYRGIISMNHYVSGAGSTDPKDEYIELAVAQNADVPVDISGWTIESDTTGKAAVIPKGTEVPSSGTINAAQDIVLLAGARALLISGQSPIGASFRENKCIGYFGSFQKFSPSLPQNCPTPNNELSSFYSGNYIRDTGCIDYVNTLPRCQIGVTPPPGSTSLCQSFVSTYLNYNGCVTAHQRDADFAGNTWHVYLGRNTSMWRTQREVVKLLDKTGKTVDAFSY